jgi:hypothetical protein
MSPATLISEGPSVQTKGFLDATPLRVDVRYKSRLDQSEELS